MLSLNQLTDQRIRTLLNSNIAAPSYDDKPYLSDDKTRQAAVLIPFFQHRQQWHILYIRRALHESDPHSGQVAFAGGKREPCDQTLVQTALREAEEEIGLSRDHVDVLGVLPVHHSISRFCIAPIVATFPWPYSLIADEAEVSRIFSIPLAWLADPGHYSIRRHRRRDGKSVAVVYFDRYDGEVLWGATARMTLSLITRLQSL